MNAQIALQLLWAATCFTVAVTGLWVTYRTVKRVTDSEFSFAVFIRDLSSVNFRIFIGCILAVVVVLTLLVGAVVNAGNLFNAEFDKDLIKLLLLFLWGMMGLDVAAFIGKRLTFKPGVQTREDATVKARTLVSAAKRRKRTTKPLGEKNGKSSAEG